MPVCVRVGESKTSPAVQSPQWAAVVAGSGKKLKSAAPVCWERAKLEEEHPGWSRGHGDPQVRSTHSIRNEVGPSDGGYRRGGRSGCPQQDAAAAPVLSCPMQLVGTRCLRVARQAGARALQSDVRCLPLQKRPATNRPHLRLMTRRPAQTIFASNLPL